MDGQVTDLQPFAASRWSVQALAADKAMLAYYFRIALKSLRRNPMLTALMIGAIAVGVGVCITTLTVYRLMSGNPMERATTCSTRSLDSWDPNSPGTTIIPSAAARS